MSARLTGHTVHVGTVNTADGGMTGLAAVTDRGDTAGSCSSSLPFSLAMSNFDAIFLKLACVTKKKHKRREGLSEGGEKRRKVTCVVHHCLLSIVLIALSVDPVWIPP
jgi:hypothetical protein